MENTLKHKNQLFYVIAPNIIWRWIDVHSNSIEIKILISSFTVVTRNNAKVNIRAISVLTDAKKQSWEWALLPFLPLLSHLSHDDCCHVLHHFLSPVHWLFNGQSGLSITQIWPYHSHSWNSSMASRYLSIKSRLLYVAFFICLQSHFYRQDLPGPNPTAHTLQP